MTRKFRGINYLDENSKHKDELYIVSKQGTSIRATEQVISSELNNGKHTSIVVRLKYSK